jgi:hypothetical protein
VTTLGDIKLDQSAIGCRKLVRAEHILGDVKCYGAPHVGIGLFEILDHLIATELQFVRSRPIQFRLPLASDSASLFFAAIFGSLEASLATTFRARYFARIGVEEKPCDESNFTDFLDNHNLFVRRLTSLFLSPERQPGWGHETCIFLCFPDAPSDVLDFWNLRALGWNVLPFPRTAEISDVARKYLLELIDRTYAPYRNNPNLFARTTILKSRHCTEEDAIQFAEALGLEKPSNSVPKVVLQASYPRMWDERYRRADDTHCCEIKAGQCESEHPDDVEEHIHVAAAAPVCIDDLAGQSGPRFANLVYVKSYSARAPLAEVMPECDDTMCAAIHSPSPDQWRFSEGGMVFFPHYATESIWMRPPDSQQVFLSWMRWLGWEVKASAPGRLATQLLRQLGGIHGVGLIAQKRLLQMMGKMAGSYLTSDEVKGEALRTSNERGRGNGSHLMKRLIESGVMRLGLEVQCPTCTQRSWHSLSDIDYDLRCPRCEDEFAVPSEAPSEMHWAYRARGAFDIPKQAHGVYCVLLVARFFSQVVEVPTTPVFGFEATQGDCKIEVDYGAITAYRSMMEDHRAVIFAECKTFNRFCQKDVERMSVLARRFDNAVLVFATLNDSLTNQEQRAIISFARRCRKDWKAKRKRNVVLILTGTELFADFGPPQCWDRKDGDYKIHAQRNDVFRNLEAIGQATQHIYLGLPPG